MSLLSNLNIINYSRYFHGFQGVVFLEVFFKEVLRLIARVVPLFEGAIHPF